MDTEMQKFFSSHLVFFYILVLFSLSSSLSWIPSKIHPRFLPLLCAPYICAAATWPAGDRNTCCMDHAGQRIPPTWRRQNSLRWRRSLDQAQVLGTWTTVLAALKRLTLSLGRSLGEALLNLRDPLKRSKIYTWKRERDSLLNHVIFYIP